MVNKISIKPREIVILAENFDKLVNWYINILGFKELNRYKEDYFYSYLATKTGIKIGIAELKQMGVDNPNRRKNTLILQIEVDDVNELFEYLKDKGGSVLFGPSFDEKDKYWYGSFTDLEGNEIWVVDTNCP